MNGVGRQEWRRSLGIGVIVALLCAASLSMKVFLRYGPRPYLLYGDPSTALPAKDAITWNLHALNLIEGRGLGDYLKQFRAANYVPPGHPFLLGFLHLFLGPDWHRIGWGIAILGCVTPLLGYLTGREMFGRRIGLLMALLVTLHPPPIYIAFSTLSEPSAILATAVALWVAAMAVRRMTARHSFAAGLALGCAGLVRPSVLAFPWGVLAAQALRNTPWRKRGRAMGLMILGLLLPLGLWTLRNRWVHGEWSFVYSSISARHAWTGANPKYRPFFYSRSAWHETLWRDPGASELEMIRRLQRETRAWVREEPARHIVSCIWRMRPIAPELFQSKARIRWSPGGWDRFFFTALITLFLIGAVRTATARFEVCARGEVREEIPGYVWCALFLVGLAVALAGVGVYGAADRYRWPLEYALCPMAAVALDGLLRLRRVPFAARVSIRSQWPVPSKPMRAAKWTTAIAVMAVTSVYVAVLVYRYRHPTGPEAVAPRLSEARVRAAFAELGLAEELEQQGRWITYAEVFEEQARNYGALQSFNDKLVAWWGRVRVVHSDADGAPVSGYVILGPMPGDFGGARLPFQRMPGAPGGRRRLRDGDVVTFLARLHSRNRPLEVPTLVFYEFLFGRFDRGLSVLDE